jgi:tetratricopeptide (TPR) repeat protein
MRATGSTWRSFMVAALFAVHPLNVESVAWVAERKGLLSAFFCFAMLAAYGWYAKATSWPRYLVVVGTFILALMAKAMAVTMPLTLLLVDYWPLGRFVFACETGSASSLENSRKRTLKLFAEKVPLLLISAASSYMAVIAQRSTGTLNTAQPLTEHLKNAAVAYGTYLGKAFWPSGPAVYYPYPEGAIPWSKVGLSLLALATITALAIWLRRERFIMAGWLFFLLTLLPVIGVVQVGGQAMADRYAYLPLIGVFIMVVWGAAEIRKRLSIPRAMVAMAALCALSGLSFVARTTLGYWQNSVTLFTRAEQIASSPDSVIEINLGRAYNDLGRPDDAFQHFKVAKAVAPHASTALYNIGTYLVQHGQARCF